MVATKKASTKPQKRLLNFLGLKSRHLLGKKLESVLTPINGGLWKYIKGWNDERVRKYVEQETGTTCTIYNVQHYRATVFGPLINQPPRGAGSKESKVDSAEIEHLHNLLRQSNMRITRLEGMIKNLEKKFDSITSTQDQPEE